MITTDYSGTVKTLPSENGYFYSDDDFSNWFDSTIELLFTPVLGVSDYPTTTDSTGKSIQTIINSSGGINFAHHEGQQPFVVRF